MRNTYTYLNNIKTSKIPFALDFAYLSYLNIKIRQDGPTRVHFLTFHYCVSVMVSVKKFLLAKIFPLHSKSFSIAEMLLLHKSPNTTKQTGPWIYDRNEDTQRMMQEKRCLRSTPERNLARKDPTS